MGDRKQNVGLAEKVAISRYGEQYDLNLCTKIQKNRCFSGKIFHIFIYTTVEIQFADSYTVKNTTEI